MTAVREYPVFVPFEGEHLSAVVSLPEGEPDALAVLMTGLGSPRSHRYQVWTRLARRLTEAGIATVRMDYVGLGDSTGSWEVMPFDAPLSTQVRAVTEFAARATGAGHVVMIGNCWGAGIALQAAESTPSCVGAVLVRAGTASRRAQRQAKASNRAGRIGRAVLATPMGPWLRRRRQARRQAFSAGVSRGPYRPAAFVPFLQRASVLFVSAEGDRRYRTQLKPYLEALLPRLGAGLAERCASVVVPGASLEGFESMDIQERVIEAIASWVPRHVGNPSGPKAGAGLPSRPPEG